MLPSICSPLSDTSTILRTIAGLPGICLNRSRGGGPFLIHTQGKEVLARNFREREWADNDGVILVEQCRILDNWSRIHSHWMIFDGDKRHDVEISLRLYSASELIALLKDCGFSAVDIYGSLTGDPYDHKAQRLVAAARKQGRTGVSAPA